MAEFIPCLASIDLAPVRSYQCAACHMANGCGGPQDCVYTWPDKNYQPLQDGTPEQRTDRPVPIISLPDVQIDLTFFTQ